jgi:hypothetical protein
MQAPRRIQRMRAKGWKKPTGAIDVTRPGRFGNPIKVIQDTAGWWAMTDAQNGIPHSNHRAAAATAVALFREHANLPENIALIREHLRGHNLMCWCTLCPAHQPIGRPFTLACTNCDPCHCDVLGEVANGVTALPARYTVHATSTQPTKLITREIASAIPILGTVETLGEALAMIKTAYETGAAYACQIDTRPEEPTPPDAAELERLAAITPQMTRNMEPGRAWTWAQSVN